MSEKPLRVTVTLQKEQAERLNHRASKMRRKIGPALALLIEPILSKGPRLPIAK